MTASSKAHSRPVGRTTGARRVAWRYLALVGCAAVIGCTVLAGCTCARTEQDEEAKPSPLVEVALNLEKGEEVAMVVGSTEALPLFLVIGSDPKLCGQVRPHRGPKRHLVCAASGGSDAEARLRVLLGAVKAAYPRHVQGPSVTLVAAEDAADMAGRLMSQDPAFFSEALIWATASSARRFGASFSANVGPRGARRLVLIAPGGENSGPIIRAAARAGLQMTWNAPGSLGAGPGQLAKSLALLAASPTVSSEPVPARVPAAPGSAPLGVGGQKDPSRGE